MIAALVMIFVASALPKGSNGQELIACVGVIIFFAALSRNFALWFTFVNLVGDKILVYFYTRRQTAHNNAYCLAVAFTIEG